MRIFGMGWLEFLIIVLIICIIFGPSLFKKIRKKGKETASAAKKSIENGAKAAGAEVDLDNINKDTILDKVDALQDRVDQMFAGMDEDDDEAVPAEPAPVVTHAEPDPAPSEDKQV